MPTRSPYHAAFGLAVRQLREDRQLSQEELGYEADVHRNYVGGVERGELNASLASIVKLAKGLGVTPSELLVLAEKNHRGRGRSRR
jgi:transcriptional regulator with XRE-family HTH domain